jgi:dihydrofolate reductase
LRRVILFIASSLEGHIAREDGTIDWLFTDGDYGYKQFYDSVDTVLLGRKTYDQVLEFTKSPFEKRNALFSPGNLTLHMIMICSMLTIP